ncbi:MAG TPA: sigma 54-interacting transcriptional regulator [Bryobacteraceae bacterium]|nr:sigma 54-interacting transcriptional regulator [Bryobacteraceae bacterium]
MQATAVSFAQAGSLDFGGMIGSSHELHDIWHSVQMVARTDSAVLIQGETGTGKELVAKAVHEESLRSRGPFVIVNCAAMPAGLLESELFGHERGAFTGALNQTTGRFQQAHNGTLFLDEIGDLPLELQPKLLRALQEREFERLGGDRTIRVDVRFVAATNQDLMQMVQERRFRADLFYRLNVYPILLPPLRDRRADIPALVRHFVATFAARMNKRISHIPDEVMQIVSENDWPGNIRELQNLIERAVIMSPGPELRLPAITTRCSSQEWLTSKARTLAEAEREHILKALSEAGGIVGGPQGAASRLGVPRTSLLYRMRRLGIKKANMKVLTAGPPRISSVAYSVPATGL